MVMNTIQKKCCTYSDSVIFSPLHSSNLLYIYALKAEMSFALQDSNILQSTVHWAQLDLPGHKNIQMDRTHSPLC